DDEAEIGLADQVGERQIVAPVAAGNFRGEAEMAGGEGLDGSAGATVVPAPREPLLLFPLQHRGSIDPYPRFVPQIPPFLPGQHLRLLTHRARAIGIHLWRKSIGGPACDP